jgi:putative DNA primase/helicase
MNIAQTLETQKHLGENQGFWEYTDLEGNLICYVVRTMGENGKKSFYPLTFQEGKWVKRWFPSVNDQRVPKPIYNVRSLILNPEKPVLIVEGEKTADAGIKLFPEFNVITWMGGAQSVKSILLDCLKEKDIYLMPDNDKPSFDAMELLSDRLESIAFARRLVDIRKLGVSNGWDIADIEHGEVDFEDIRELVLDAEVLIPKFKTIEANTFPSLSEKGRILNSSDNTKHQLQFYNIQCSYNLVTNRIEIFDKSKKYSITNEYDCHLANISDLCIKNGVPKIDLDKHLLLIADENRYSPVIDFIESKPWDGVSRIESFINTVEALDDHLFKILINKWMLGAIAAAYTDVGVSLPGVLVFQGAQGLGKTQWFKSLLPSTHQHLLKDGLTLDPNNKDSVMSCLSVWLGELGELDATFSKSAISYLKSFITKSIDYFRPHYGRTEKQFPRRTIYFGSVNNGNYLVDDTGNRRWWTVSVKKINWRHGLDMQQVWAEYKHLFDEGASYQLNEDEFKLLNESNKNYEVIEPLDEKVQTMFDWDNHSRRYVTCSEILFEMGYEKPTRSEANKLACILNNLGLKKGTGRQRRSYAFPYQPIMTRCVTS